MPEATATTNPAKNIAETLASVLPKAEMLRETGDILHFALPKDTQVKEFDLEKTLPNPRRMKTTAAFATAESFLAYVARHASTSTVAWCDFNPQTFALKFSAVIDDHAPASPGWRTHLADFEPNLSAEWKAWKSNHGKAFPQVMFAEWLQEHEEDIRAAGGLPTSLQMLEMATNFVMNEERTLKSAVRLQSGGTRLTFIADPDQGTTEAMQLFEKFALGIPVFHGGTAAWGITARLKYRNTGGKLTFIYELIRADRVHEAAAKELIDVVRSGLGSVPLLMGACA